MQEVTDVVAWYVKTLLNKVVYYHKSNRIVEQLKNLFEYFLTFLPEQKNFKKKIKNTLRYKRISEYLKSKFTVPYWSFVGFIAIDFEKFLITFQSNAPLIHLLYNKSVTLLKSLMAKFIGFNMLTQKENWLNVNLKESKAVKTNVFDVGAKTKLLLLELDQLQVKEFRSHALNCLLSATSYFQKKLPLNNQIMKDARFLNPINRNSKNALNGISCLALTFGKLFKTSSPIVFSVKSDSVDEYKLCDIIKNEFTRYETEIVSEDTPKIHPKTQVNLVIKVLAGKRRTNL